MFALAWWPLQQVIDETDTPAVRDWQHFVLAVGVKCGELEFRNVVTAEIDCRLVTAMVEHEFPACVR